MADTAQRPITKKALAELLGTLLQRGALPGENDNFSDKAAKEAAKFVAEIAYTRKNGDVAIAIDDHEGPKGRLLSRIAIVNDDMPFIVDSLAQGLSARSIDLFRIIHPLMKAERDKSGRMRDAFSRDDEQQGRNESVVYLEIGRIEEKDREDVRQTIIQILESVRAATSDWRALQARMSDTADSLPEGEGQALMRWLLDDRFTLLAAERISTTNRRSKKLGISTIRDDALVGNNGVERAIDWFQEGNPGPLFIKSSIVSPVHRHVLLDLLLVPVSKDGSVVAVDVIGGLWTSGAMMTSPTEVPLMRAQLAQMMDELGFSAQGHAGKALVHAMTQLPHDLLIGFSVEEQKRAALTAMSISDRPRPELLVVQSSLRRQAFVFVWLPRDDINTKLREAVSAMITEAAGTTILNWAIGLEDGQVALLRYTLDMRDRDTLLDEEALNRRLKIMVRGWQPAIANALTEMGHKKQAAQLARDFSGLFSTSYRLEYGAAEAARDILRLSRLGIEDGEARTEDNSDLPLENGSEMPQSAGATPQMGCFGARLYYREDDAPGIARLKIYHLGGPVPLSDAVPALENFGFGVLEERPSELERADKPHIHDFKLDICQAGDVETLIKRASIIEAAVVAVLDGEAENDPFNALMTSAELDHQPVVWLRAFFRYLRQTGLSYSMATVRAALARSPAATRALIGLFSALHEPGANNRDKRAQDERDRFTKALEDVSALDEDRVLRLMLALVEACLRTNAFAPCAGEALAFKIDSANVPGLPKPVPWREIFVYSPRFEGVHLRAGPVARGGIRWSDRRDDFRTEILGLMKAQRVKNAVIVPTGAKGGFYPKQLPDPQVDRDAWAAEGRQAYIYYIRSLLSITDNLDGDTVVHPDQVVRRDGDDPYFVVAADKGTARFSDTANEIAQEQDFWLDDAFASGGSHGYDHKAMGITARGAWRSVEQHFAELGLDVSSDIIRTVGVGDMSGDVFGNGMLLSKSLKLVAAFDHRHIFIDPDPDPVSSWEERKRLFELERSSWEDYDKRRISKGGGVFSRSSKTIALSAEIKALLGLDEDSSDPQHLISAILRAHVDLLWFGGIGTYVKSADEVNSQVGDPGNDRIRIDGAEVGARVIGEGANLGVTQAGRIEYALGGGRINTDFIDNSAGVDCSDNEVNIKIALGSEMRDETLSRRARNTLLTRMTDQVSEIVLEDNRLQALGLSISEYGGADATAAHVRLIERFEMTGRLDRKVEGLADSETLMRRAQDGKGLQRPELAVLFSTAKLALQDAVETSAMGHSSALDEELLTAFPKAMRKNHADAIKTHRLRGEIVATKIANRIINRLGPLHPFELAEEEGTSLGQIAEAYWLIEKLFDLPKIYRRIDETEMPEDARIALFDELGRVVRGHVADLVRTGLPNGEPGELLMMLSGHVERLLDSAARLSDGHIEAALEDRKKEWTDRDIPEKLAESVLQLRRIDGLFGIVELAARRETDPVKVAEAFIGIGKQLNIEWIGPQSATLNPSDPWDRLLLAGVVRDMQQMRLEFLGRARSADFQQFIDNWIEEHGARIEQFRHLVERAREATSCTVSILAQVAQHARLLLSR